MADVVKIETQSIRHDDPHLFDRSTVLTGVNTMHYPYLVVETITTVPETDPRDPPEYAPGSVVRLVQVREVFVLLQYPDDTVVLWIWAGQHRSDYFRFTVGEFRAARTGQRQHEMPS